MFKEGVAMVLNNKIFSFCLIMLITRLIIASGEMELGTSIYIADFDVFVKCKEKSLLGLVGKEKTGPHFTEGVQDGSRIIGLMVAINRIDKQDFDSTDAKLFNSAANGCAVFVENGRLFVDLKELFIGSLKALVRSIDAKDAYTHGHSERVALTIEETLKEVKRGLGTQFNEKVGREFINRNVYHLWDIMQDGLNEVYGGESRVGVNYEQNQGNRVISCQD